MALRPDLYRRLEQRFGDVSIAREGEEMEARTVVDPIETDRHGWPKKSLQVDAPGEAYRINCPFCTDTRKRLWINHMWGFRDESNQGVSYLWLVHCFNENCLTQYHLRQELYKMIYDDVGYGQRPCYDVINQGVRYPATLAEAEAPGALVHLSKLETAHPACSYLRSRGYDPVDLYQYYRVCYCTEAKPAYPLVTGRLVVPIYKHNKLVGWQARLLGEASDRRIPKYYTMPNFQKGSVLYNSDIASKYPYVVVTEGVFDAWRYGPQAVALLGNKPSHLQGNFLIQVWRPGVIFCMLDGEARSENQALYDLLSVQHRKVVRVDLPVNKDPGTCTRDELHRLVEDAAAAKGFLIKA